MGPVCSVWLGDGGDSFCLAVVFFEATSRFFAIKLGRRFVSFARLFLAVEQFARDDGVSETVDSLDECRIHGIEI